MKISAQREKAYLTAGYRERYAMENGNEAITRYGNHDCLVYSYGTDDEYQDANGATWDMVEGRWIG